VVLIVILIVIVMSLVMPKVRLLGPESGLRRVQEGWELIRIGFVLELVGVGGYLLCISSFSSGKYIYSLLIPEILIWKITLFHFKVRAIELFKQDAPNVMFR
jgi:hypothetical protein